MMKWNKNQTKGAHGEILGAAKHQSSTSSSERKRMFFLAIDSIFHWQRTYWHLRFSKRGEKTCFKFLNSSVDLLSKYTSLDLHRSQAVIAYMPFFRFPHKHAFIQSKKMRHSIELISIYIWLLNPVAFLLQCAFCFYSQCCWFVKCIKTYRFHRCSQCR